MFLRRRPRTSLFLFLLGALTGLPACDADVDADGFSDAGADGSLSVSDGLGCGAAGSPQVLRDARGVPHIVAENLPQAMYATGWVHAEDRLFQMQVRRLRMQGRLAEFFAPGDVSGEDDTDNRTEALVRSDRRFRTLGHARAAARTVAAMDHEHRVLLEAYAAGVNAQLRARPSLGTAFADFGIAEVEPWTAADALLGWEAVGETFASTLGAAQLEVGVLNGCAEGECAALTCAQAFVDNDAAVVPPPADGMWPPTDDAYASLPSGTGSLMPGAPIRPPVNVKASQGFVVAAEHMSTGRPFLFGEPQIWLEAPSTWYELHIVVPSEDIDVRGVGFAGSPGVVIFYGRHVAQTVTSGGGDIADLFRMQPTDDGAGYTIDGRVERYDTREEVIEVRHQEPETLTVRETRFGPVVSDLLDGVPANTVLAVRHANSLRPGSHSVIAGIELLRADSLESYRDALRHWVTPQVNALYAGVDADDGESHIGYHALTTIARRAPQQIGATDVTGRHPHDGSRSDQDWRGAYDLNWNPHVIDPASGMLFSGNHLPVGTWYDAFLYSGLSASGDTVRSFEVRTHLNALVDAPGTVTPDQLRALHVDVRSETATRLHRALEIMSARGFIPADDPGIAPREEAQAAARVLSGLDQWLAIGGGDMDQRVPGDFLARRFVVRMTGATNANAWACRWGGRETGLTHFLREFADDESLLGPNEAAAITRAAYQALLDVSVEHGVEVAAWASDPAPVTPRTVPFQRNFGCLSPHGTGSNCSSNPARDVDMLVPGDFVHTIASSAASSWPFNVDFADPNAARAVLAPGISEEPRSPHFDDQLPVIEAKGRGERDALPAAPLNLRDIRVMSRQTLPLER
ncbi:MAG: penicillin acylase family protein [Sandaracinaceae bacterium]